MRFDYRGLTALALLSPTLLWSGCKSPIAPVRTGIRPASHVPSTVRGSRRVELGEFHLTGNRLLVSDPAYAESESQAKGLLAEIQEILPGTWQAEALQFTPTPGELRCAELLAFHATHRHTGACHWIPGPGVVAVDSGQAGLFDPAHAQDGSVVPKSHKWGGELVDPDNPWYSLCCDVTLSPTLAGVIPFGAVASSGYGDGGYACFTCRSESGKVTGIRLVFISQEDEESQ